MAITFLFKKRTWISSLTALFQSVELHVPVTRSIFRLTGLRGWFTWNLVPLHRVSVSHLSFSDTPDELSYFVSGSVHKNCGSMDAALACRDVLPQCGCFTTGETLASVVFYKTTACVIRSFASFYSVRIMRFRNAPCRALALSGAKVWRAAA